MFKPGDKVRDSRTGYEAVVLSETHAGAYWIEYETGVQDCAGIHRLTLVTTEALI